MKPREVAFLFIFLVAAASLAAEATDKLEGQPIKPAKVIIVNDDGFSGFFTGTYRSATDVRKRILTFRHTPVAVFEWSFLAGSRSNYQSNVTELIGTGLREYPRRGDKLASDVLREMADRGIDLTTVVAKACHDAGIACYASMRMNGDYSVADESVLIQHEFNSDFWWQKPELRIRNEKGAAQTRQSYAFPEVCGYRLAILREIAERDIDGVNLDFMRHPPFFGYEEPLLQAFREKYKEDARSVGPNDPRWLRLRCDMMSDFVRSVRTLLDEVGKKRGRCLGLSVRVDWREYRAWGCDVDRWVKSGWLDYVVFAQHSLGGYDFDLTPFVENAKGTRCKVYFGEEAMASGHDLTDAEDRLIAEGKMQPPERARLSPARYQARAMKWHQMGADGVQLFNLEGEALEAVVAAGAPWQTEPNQPAAGR